MLDIKFIRENKEKIADAAEKKGIDLNLVELLELDKKRLSQLQYIEELQAEKNKLNELLPKADAEEKIVLLEQAKAVKEKLATAEPEFKIIKDAFDELMVKVPNIISGDT